MEKAAESLVRDFAQLLGEEYRLLRGVGSGVAELRDDLEAMNALLLMQSEAEDGTVDPFVGVMMKQVRELAYDSEDCVSHYKLRVKCHWRGGALAWSRRLLGTLFLRHRLAGQIKALRARGIAIAERQARYSVNRDALRRTPLLPTAPTMLTAASPSALANNGLKAVGIEGQVDTLTEKLKAAAVDGQPKVVSIVGFGGLGKTTLAMEVCQRLEMDFPSQATVSVSQAFDPGRDIKTLLKGVLQQVVKARTGNGTGIKDEGALGDINSMDDIKLGEKLGEVLKDKRYLIVIDDVWTVRAWEAIQFKLPKNDCSSRIIVTTRMASVAKACCPDGVSGHYIHEMESLGLGDSKKLFLSRAFGSAPCPVELEPVMDDILKKCGGLPLAIVSLASVLAGYRTPGSRDKWETICNSIGSQMETHPTLEGMRRILTLSYNQLPHELKGCMMYFSIFPEDYQIDKGRLVQRWIAEGLVMEKRGMSLLEIAKSYVDELVARNMIQPHFGYQGDLESCRVHDMLLELMVSRSLESNFASLLGGQYAAMSYDRIRRLSIQGDEERRPKSAEKPKTKTTGWDIKGMDVEHVRSLSMFHNGGQKLLDHLDKFTLLRVLDLQDCEGLKNKHMTYICKLYLLRFLSVKGTDISKVPSQIGKLEHLQTFNAHSTCINELPKTVTNLEKLEHLELYNKNDFLSVARLPRQLKKMKALQYVGLAAIGNDIEVAKDVGELEQLEELKLYIDSKEIAPGSNVLGELAKSLSKSYSLRRLFVADLEDTSILEFLHDLPSAPQHLRFLKIGGRMSSLPKWFGSLAYLVEFRMSWARLDNDELFDVLCELPNLKIIRVEYKCYVGNTLLARTRHNFPSLVYLDIYDGSDPMPKRIEFEEKTMPKLETLHVNFGSNTRSIIGVKHLTNLKEVQISIDKNNGSLDDALKKLEDENSTRRPNSKQFHVTLKYW